MALDISGLLFRDWMERQEKEKGVHQKERECVRHRVQKRSGATLLAGDAFPGRPHVELRQIANRQLTFDKLRMWRANAGKAKIMPWFGGVNCALINFIVTVMRLVLAVSEMPWNPALVATL